MEKFGFLEQLSAGDRFDSFLLVLKDYHLNHKLFIYKLNFYAKPYQRFQEPRNILPVSVGGLQSKLLQMLWVMIFVQHMNHLHCTKNEVFY